jgi:hypothetical protein
MFNSNKEDIQDGGGYMSPGIHDNVKITKVEAHEITAKSDLKYNVLDITFTNGKNESFNHRLFDPMHTEDEEKRDKNAQNIANDIAYIGGKATGKDVEVTASNWEELTALAVKVIPVNGVLYKLKLNGNVYNGNARVQITSYPGWLKTMASNESIKFSRKENESNAEYHAHMNPQAASASAGTMVDPPF